MIRFDHLSLTYPNSSRPTLADISLTIPEGDLCVVMGRTGTGKSTLLGAINGLVPHFTGGLLQGSVTVDGRSTADHRPRDMADLVGYVGQNPLHSFVATTVEEEIAYGMEQQGLAAAVMRKRVEETLDLLGIAALRNRPLPDLSGGEQQRVALAAVLAMHPRVLVLDEPTSSLDPTAAQDVLAAITTLVHEVGLTVVLAEHRLERVMHAADSMIWLPGDGRAVMDTPARILAQADVVPPLAELARWVGWSDVPLSVRDARRRVLAEDLVPLDPKPSTVPLDDAPVSVRARHLCVEYGLVRAVREVDLDLHSGTVTVVMGRNGAGKSSLLWALQGSQPSTGPLDVEGTDPRTLSASAARALIGLVPQSASDLLYLPTVAAECEQADRETGSTPGTCAQVLSDLGIALPMTANPRDLSEGERLVLVCAIQVCARPRVILLDEPTRGLDYATKAHLTHMVRSLARAGATVVVSTHDVEWAAHIADRIIAMADGEIVTDGPAREVCLSSPVFAPQLAKVFAPHPVLTMDDVGGCAS